MRFLPILLLLWPLHAGAIPVNFTLEGVITRVSGLVGDSTLVSGDTVTVSAVFETDQAPLGQAGDFVWVSDGDSQSGLSITSKSGAYAPIIAGGESVDLFFSGANGGGRSATVRAGIARKLDMSIFASGPFRPEEWEDTVGGRTITFGSGDVGRFDGRLYLYGSGFPLDNDWGLCGKICQFSVSFKTLALEAMPAQPGPDPVEPDPVGPDPVGPDPVEPTVVPLPGGALMLLTGLSALAAMRRGRCRRA